MKSFIIQSNVAPKEKEIKFPVLAKYKTDDNFVVLFTSEHCGVVLQVGDTKWSVGCYDGKFLSVSDRNHWEILPNNYQLILQNDQ